MADKRIHRMVKLFLRVGVCEDGNEEPVYSTTHPKQKRVTDSLKQFPPTFLVDAKPVLDSIYHIEYI